MLNKQFQNDSFIKQHYYPYITIYRSNLIINLEMGNNANKQKAAKIPVTDSPADVKARAALFSKFDMNANGYLSLAQIDKGIRDVLEIPELFQAKPVLIRAYVAACKKLVNPSPLEDNLVTKGIFKFLVIYLRFYYELWIDFKSIQLDKDRRVSEVEFVNGAKKIQQNWHIHINNPKVLFRQLLERYHEQAQLTFTDFCDFIISERFKQQANHDNHEFC